MPTAADVKWFKDQFADQLRAAAAGTPFTIDMLTAIACQETGYIWSTLYKQGIAPDRILKLCTGDTIDAKPGGGGRRAFPQNRAQLVAHANGAAMFAVARAALVEMAHYVPGYNGAVANPDKFCHAFGVFQYDLQFLDQDRDYFLNGGYADFETAAGKCVQELTAAARRARLDGKPSLTDLEMAAVAIAYNRGRYDPAKGLKQGYFDGQFYYGEYFYRYLQLAQSVPTAPPGQPTAATAMTVVAASGINLRSSPDRTANNVIGQLPRGATVQATSLTPVAGFLAVTATIGGQAKSGYAWSAYLTAAG